MSWWVYLNDDRGHSDGDWNYTSNTNAMIRAAASATGQTVVWWEGFQGLPGPVGAAYLAAVVKELEANPDTYDALNPPNGWGDRESLVKVLVEMRDSVPEWPTVWSISG